MRRHFEQTKELLGTQIRIIVLGDAISESYIEEAFNECRRIEQTYSRFIDNNELSVLNSKLGQWVSVSPEFFNLIEFGVNLSNQTNGVFDMTVKSILEAWGYDRDYSLQEKGEGNLGKIELKNGKVRTSAEIDLGAFGKGYAIDRMVEILAPIKDFYINAGGDIYAKGEDLNGPWRAYFEHPLNIDQAIGFVDFFDMALACSNPLRRKWRDKHHLVDPIKKLPANDMLAVYTQAKTAILADAYSTALFVLGYENAKGMIKDFPVSAMLVSKNGGIWKSDKFKGELYGATTGN